MVWLVFMGGVIKWKPTPVFLPGESHGQRNPVGYSPYGCTKSTTDNLAHTHNFISESMGRLFQGRGRDFSEHMMMLQVHWKPNLPPSWS